MDLIYKVTLGNMNNGDSVSYTPNNSDVPVGFINKIENTRAKTVMINDKEDGVIEQIIDCQTDNIQLSGEMNLKQSPTFKLPTFTTSLNIFSPPILFNLYVIFTLIYLQIINIVK